MVSPVIFPQPWSRLLLQRWGTLKNQAWCFTRYGGCLHTWEWSELKCIEERNSVICCTVSQISIKHGRLSSRFSELWSDAFNCCGVRWLKQMSHRVLSSVNKNGLSVLLVGFHLISRHELMHVLHKKICTGLFMYKYHSLLAWCPQKMTFNQLWFFKNHKCSPRFFMKIKCCLPGVLSQQRDI